MAVALQSSKHPVADPGDAIEYCYQQGWTDGLPVVPPTEDRVRPFLDAMGLAPEAVEGTWDYRLIEEVAGAAIPSHPDWVIRTGREQAETIMEEARAQAYHHAADWLAKAREAYRVADREDEWRTYLEERITRHQRKYKLRPMLEALRR